MNFRPLPYFAGLMLFVLFSVSSFLGISFLPVSAGAEEIKLLALLFLVIVYKVNFREHKFFKKGGMIILFAGIISGFQNKQINNPVLKPSVWAKSTEKVLSAAKADSIIQANAQKVVYKKKSEEPKTVNRRVGLFFLFLLGIFLCMLFGLFIFSLAWAGSIGLLGAYILTLGDAAIFSWAIHNLVKSTRKREPQKSAEMTKEDFKRERKIYFGILLSLFGLISLLFFLSN